MLNVCRSHGQTGVCFVFLSCTLKFVVLDYDKFSRSEFVAEVVLSLLDVDLVEGTTLSRHLNSKTMSDVSAIFCFAVTFIVILHHACEF